LVPSLKFGQKMENLDPELISQILEESEDFDDDSSVASRDPRLDNIDEKTKRIVRSLPRDVFADPDEEPIGLLNRAIPQGLNLDLDPDIVEALEDEGSSFEELDDEFIKSANIPRNFAKSPESDDESDRSDGLMYEIDEDEDNSQREVSRRFGQKREIVEDDRRSKF